MDSNRPSLKKAALILCGVYLLHFLIFYIPVYVVETEAVFFDYLRYVLEVAVRFSVPVAISGILLYLSTALGRSRCLLYTLLLPLPSLVFNLPYYYLYATAFGNDWQESLLYSLLICLVELIVLIANTAAVFLVSHTVACSPLKKGIIATLPPKKREGLSKNEQALILGKAEHALGESFSYRGIFDFSIPFVKGIFFGAFLEFILYVLLEVSRIISHLNEYGDFRNKELMYVMAKFIMIFVMLFLSHAVSYLVSRKFSKEKNADADI